MDHRHRAALRVLATVASALLGLLGAILVTSPAQAEPTSVSGECGWDPDASAWTVEWVIQPHPPADAAAFIIADVSSEPTGELTGPVGGSGPHDPSQPLTLTHQVSELGDGPVQLVVSVAWDDPQATTEELSGTVDCEAPPRPELVSGFTFDCRTLTITITNPDSETVRVTFEPVDGDPFGVDVAGGESANVRFPATAGQSVDVLLDGHSVVDPAEPITISKADLEAQECDGDAAAEPVGLAATGSKVALVTVGALALLGLGTGLYLVARRRRIRFTA
ncbi:hypothetical protein JQS43_18520 [Natronosporangium hydrolyticum]|uniref:LPXTG cell wall anchor domain-containing protein n=1 Tax=Natronosporangium hydrolyticum TaxID=2811111 RepID=A0A895YII3_9ACTN|nr:hypothetical protein [Natronosporangium hydrolyticum]QSB13568.1 hypothetical protein JQS43_18520 [Natronosporangium hydrolyticum]